MTEVQISAGPAQSNRSKPVTTVLANILRHFAKIGAAAQYFLGPRLSGVAQGHAENADVAADATTLFAAEGIDKETEIKSVVPVVPDQQEIDRRRNLVRTFFNEFWRDASDKPTAFVRRLDEAEDYLNGRLAANGESWRFDAKTRVLLSLPPRSNISANIDHNNRDK